jgi:hypothetical protein
MQRTRRTCVYPNLIGLVDGGNSLFAEKLLHVFRIQRSAPPTGQESALTAT